MSSDQVDKNELSDFNSSDCNSEERVDDNKFKETILLPYNYIIQNDGKRIRDVFIKAINNWLKVPECYLNSIIEITGALHNASLIIDDIEDNSEIRRGLPAAHIVFGVPLSINAGTYVIISVLDKLLKVFPHEKKVEVAQIYCEHILNAHIGQGLDIYWRENFVCPTEQEYLYMIDRKTTALFCFSFKLMELVSEEKTDLSPFIGLLGQYFQIRDDYLNLISEEYEKTKGFAEDLSEGKFSFPIIHAIKKSGDGSKVLQALKERPKDLEAKKSIVDLLKKSGSIAYTLERIKELKEKCYAEIQKFGLNEEMIQLFNRLKI